VAKVCNKHVLRSMVAFIMMFFYPVYLGIPRRCRGEAGEGRSAAMEEAITHADEEDLTHRI